MVRGDAGAAPGMVNEERTVVGYVFGKVLKWEIATKNPVKQTEKRELERRALYGWLVQSGARLLVPPPYWS